MDVSKHILISRYIYIKIGISGRREYYFYHTVSWLESTFVLLACIRRRPSCARCVEILRGFPRKQRQIYLYLGVQLLLWLFNGLGVCLFWFPCSSPALRPRCIGGIGNSTLSRTPAGDCVESELNPLIDAHALACLVDEAAACQCLELLGRSERGRI
jgi:hypothetical protein